MKKWGSNHRPHYKEEKQIAPRPWSESGKVKVEDLSGQERKTAAAVTDRVPVTAPENVGIRHQRRLIM